MSGKVSVVQMDLQWHKNGDGATVAIVVTVAIAAADDDDDDGADVIIYCIRSHGILSQHQVVFRTE